MSDIRFPQGPMVGPDGYITSEWEQWLQNPQFVSFTFPTVLAVTSGGTGLGAGTSGGILGFTNATTLASSTALSSNRIVLGGGAGATPSTPVGLGTTATVLHGNAAGVPSWGAVSLTADVSGVLPAANGGTAVATASANTVFAGPASGVAAAPAFRSVVSADLSLTTVTASLVADVAMNNTANYFDGPSVAQGTSGTWLATGTVTFKDTAVPALFDLKLWDGTSVISSAAFIVRTANDQACVSLSGVISSPAGNLRISVRDVSAATGKIIFNDSGNSKDSTITAVRIG